MPEQPHTYAGNPLDRGEAIRRDEADIETLAESSQARFLPFHKLKVAATDGQLVWCDKEEIKALKPEQTIFLGIDDDTPHFAVATSSDSLEYSDCRAIAASLANAETGIVAQARAQLDWHQRNPFCAQCGNPTRAARGGQIRRCDICDRHTFPRTDPVAIMLIVDEPGGDRCLLGQSQGFMANTNFYSALAGFLDQGESLEEAVRREVREESGVIVGDVHYHSSQPWPFPSQLMIGCHGIASDTRIEIDEVEMADVSWFSRDEVIAALAEDNSELRVPGPMAIAHHLIRSWAAGEVTI